MAMRYLKELIPGMILSEINRKRIKNPGRRKKETEGSSAFKPGDGKKQCLFFL